MAMTIPVTPMAIKTTTIAKKITTAMTITSNPDPHQTPSSSLPLIQSFCTFPPLHAQLMLRLHSKTARLVLPPHAPTCAVCPSLASATFVPTLLPPSM
uniref:Uncharacterized protein n=1 Tax=Romanomermis culicivorax TaxID=13658 RepID=A0A915I7Q9_ROMCU